MDGIIFGPKRNYYNLFDIASELDCMIRMAESGKCQRKNKMLIAFAKCNYYNGGIESKSGRVKEQSGEERRVC